MILASSSRVTHEYEDVGTRIVALDDVSLDVEGGELLVVEGPSGSGKSTLLSVLAGLQTPSRGESTLCGVSLGALDAEGRARVRRENVGFVFQSFHLFSALTARANVECVLEMKMKDLAPARRREIAEETLGKVGLGSRLEHRPDRLSGGERQRVALARALASEPKIIFGDEPTSALDAKSAALVLDCLRAFVADGRSVVLATHDPRIHAIGTRIVRLEGGRLTGPRVA
jgi:putative ABC transport system ATP-binding protein